MTTAHHRRPSYPVFLYRSYKSMQGWRKLVLMFLFRLNLIMVLAIIGTFLIFRLNGIELTYATP